MRKVLILGDDTRAFLTSVRSLGRHGVTVDAAPDDWSAPALKSRFIRRHVELPPYNLSPEAWVEALRREAEREAYDLVLPCNDRGIIPLVRHAAALGDIHAAVVNREAFDAFFDKLATRELAARVGVPVAAGRGLADDDTAERLVAEFGLPLAVKPRRSFEADTLFHRRAVKLVASLDDLQATLAGIDERSAYLVEAVFPGRGVGMSILANQGRVLQAFEHHRMHEPLRGGGSSYRVSAAPDPMLERDVAALAEATSLTGLAMFEYRRNFATGDRILLEVNARLWGSVPLPVAAGLDFPWLYYRLLVDGVEEPRVTYKVPVYSRNLTNDLDWIVETIAHVAQPGGRNAFLPLARGVAGLWRLAAGIDRLDTRAADDPEPARADAQAFRAGLAERLTPRLPHLRRRARDAAHEAVRRWATGGRPPRVLVLCRGNICRSPFAAALLERHAARRGFAVEVASAGTIPLADRSSPSEAIDAARAFDIDLVAHRSRHISDFALDDFDLVLHFDPVIEGEWQRQCRPPDMPLVNLAHFLEPALPRAVIPDPFGEGPERFQAVYRQIDDALDRLLDCASRRAV